MNSPFDSAINNYSLRIMIEKDLPICKIYEIAFS